MINFHRLLPHTLILLVLLAPSGAPAQEDARLGFYLQRQLGDIVANESIPVIVHLEDTVDIRRMAVPTRREGALRRQARAELIRTLRGRFEQSRQPLQALLAQQGVQNVRPLWMINALAFSATPEQIEEIAALPQVSAITYDQVIEKPRVETSQVSLPAEPNIDLVNAPALWSLGWFGQGVTVAVVDSGVDLAHPDLVTRWRGGSNSWFNAIAANCGLTQVTCATACDTNTTEPCDYIDGQGVAHGTGVAGLLAGGDAGGSTIGVAPDAEWIAVKIFDSADGAPESVVHQGLQWLLDPDGNPDTDDAPDVVNNSWGYASLANECPNSIDGVNFQEDVLALKAAGIAVVFSGGNTGDTAIPPNSIPPGNYPGSFAVGSVGTFDSDTEVSTFSASGPSACDGTIYPEVVAPGFFVRTADFSSGGLDPNPYLSIAGTSFAAPHASGVMALLLSAFPDATVTEIETALQESSVDLGPAGPDNSYGYGLIDAQAAYNYLAGLAEITVTDSISPETDRLLAFGNIATGTAVQATVTVRNSGSLNVQMGALDAAALPLPFSVSNDNCSGLLLAPGVSCIISVQFSPGTIGSFSGSFDILSDVPGQERTTINVTGSGFIGTRAITVTDTVGVIDDHLLDFAERVPGQNDAGSIRVRNSGTLPLLLGQVDAGGVNAPFSIADDGCSNLTLGVNQACLVDVLFAPGIAGSFTGSLAILSNADAFSQQRITVDLSGAANTPPAAPTPLQPANGARVGTDVTFFWAPASDADGDRVEQFLVYDTDPNFGSPTERQLDPVAATLLGGGLLLVGLAAGLQRRRKLAVLLLAAGLVLGVAACSGGGGGDDGPGLPADAQSTVVQGLTSGNTYYWKMVARDSRGAETESGVRSFLVE